MRNAGSRKWFHLLFIIVNSEKKMHGLERRQTHGNGVHINLQSKTGCLAPKRRFPSPKTKPCKKLKKSLLFAFGHSLFFLRSFFFFHVSPSHCRTQNRFGHVPGKLEISRCTETCIGPTVGAVGPTVGAGWLHWSSSFVTLPIFWLEQSFLHQNKAWRLGFSKHPPKRKFPPTETICRILYSTRSWALR